MRTPDHARRCAKRLAPPPMLAITLAAVAAVLSVVAGCAQPLPIPVPQARVKRGVIRIGPDEVRISGLEPIRGWGVNRDTTFVHALELVLAAVGRPIPYDELMGLSGAAFRVQAMVDGWDASAPDPLVGHDCLPALMSSIGLDYQVYYVRRDQVSEAERLRREIARSIDEGRPVLASNVMPQTDWGIIVGYKYRGREWWCRSYAEDARDVDQPARGWPDAVVVLTAIKPVTDMRPAYLASIRRAVELYEMPAAGSYALGRAALGRWADDLMRVGGREYMHPSAWMLVSLIDARTAAVEYLRRLATVLPEHKPHLNAAADIYDKERRLLADALPYAPFPRQYPVGVPGEDIRGKLAEALRQASGLEKTAVEILKRVK